MGVPAAGQKEEFLFNHGNTVSSRHWGEKLTYSLGVSYLAGEDPRTPPCVRSVTTTS